MLSGESYSEFAFTEQIQQHSTTRDDTYSMLGGERELAWYENSPAVTSRVYLLVSGDTLFCHCIIPSSFSWVCMACLYSPHFLPSGCRQLFSHLFYHLCCPLMLTVTKVLLPSVLLCIFLFIFSFPTHLSRLSLLLIIVSSASCTTS